MDKMKDMQHNQIADDQLEQVAGGRNLFEVITTEFTELFNEPQSRKNGQNTADDNNIGISTLEMRVDPLKKRDAKDSRKTIKL